MTEVKIIITGFDGCGYYHRAIDVGKSLSENHSEVNIETICLPRPQFKAKLTEWRAGLEPRAQRHESSPFIWKEQRGARTFIGGCDDFTYFAHNY